MRHVISALVMNEPGVLAHVAGMFSARGFNIDSLVVGRTEDAAVGLEHVVGNFDGGVLIVGEQGQQRLGQDPIQPADRARCLRRGCSAAWAGSRAGCSWA